VGSRQTGLIAVVVYLLLNILKGFPEKGAYFGVFKGPGEHLYLFLQVGESGLPLPGLPSGLLELLLHLDLELLGAHHKVGQGGGWDGYLLNYWPIKPLRPHNLSPAQPGKGLPQPGGGGGVNHPSRSNAPRGRKRRKTPLVNPGTGEKTGLNPTL